MVVFLWWKRRVKMKTNHRHCEERQRRRQTTKQSNCLHFVTARSRRSDSEGGWIASLLAFARGLAMTSFLAVITTPAVACHAWLATWRNHSGALPNSSHQDTGGSNIGFGTWSVTANFGSGIQTIRGEFMCAAGGSWGRCYCRRATTEGYESWSVDHSSARGSGRSDCSGNKSSVCGGPWVFVRDSWFIPPFAFTCVELGWCGQHCAGCVRNGSDGSCTRAAVLQ